MRSASTRRESSAKTRTRSSSASSSRVLSVAVGVMLIPGVSAAPSRPSERPRIERSADTMSRETPRAIPRPIVNVVPRERRSGTRSSSPRTGPREVVKWKMKRSAEGANERMYQPPARGSSGHNDPTPRGTRWGCVVVRAVRCLRPCSRRLWSLHGREGAPCHRPIEPAPPQGPHDRACAGNGLTREQPWG